MNSNSHLLETSTLVLADRTVTRAQIRISGNGLIEAIQTDPQKFEDASNKEVLSGILAPGMLDLHLNGFSGLDNYRDANNPQFFNLLERSLLNTGVTSYLLTLISSPLKRMISTLETLASHTKNQKYTPLGFLGFYLEGPFLNSQKMGTHPLEFLQKITPDSLSRIETFQQKNPNTPIRVITIAPEEEGGIDAISQFKKWGIFTALGHSVSDYETALKAQAAGATLTTHLFNAMSPLHHRFPGLPGASLAAHGHFVELICDGIHIHPAVLSLAIQIKGADEVICVTDATSAAGMPEGSYFLDEIPVTLKKGLCLNQKGELAGSALTMIQTVRNLRNWLNISFHDIFKMTSLNPARALQLDQHLGSIAIGKEANLILLDQETLDIKKVWLRGKPIQLK